MYVEYVIKTLITIVLSGLIGYLVAKVKQGKVYERAIKALTKDAYFRSCRYIIQEHTEDITEAEYENFNDLYEVYHALGMNGTGDKLHEQITKDKKIDYKEI